MVMIVMGMGGVIVVLILVISLANMDGSEQCTQDICDIIRIDQLEFNNRWEP